MMALAGILTHALGILVLVQYTVYIQLEARAATEWRARLLVPRSVPRCPYPYCHAIAHVWKHGDAVRVRRQSIPLPLY